MERALLPAAFDVALIDVAFESNLIDPHTLVIPTGAGAPATVEGGICFLALKSLNPQLGEESIFPGGIC